METQTLELVFTTDKGKTCRFTIPQAAVPVNEANVNRVMDKIIATNIFTTNGGGLVAKKSARLVGQTISEIALA
ncbi:DUF2922 domain-containing protein [Aneurinibacillus terranovensis]|uniref:DUF2922 domain-containing protein n=1 Tax=Aneurinibacillus terranovensis TaxID=278991 RepID=UPI0004207616|nr:DUF2922 domain-containing protein [Aneurinibacillus terranovensis]